MDVKTILGLTSAVFGAGVIAHQDPSFEYPVVKPVLTSGPTQPENNYSGTDYSEPVFQKSISVRFKDASASDVLDWLSNQGVSFVTSEVPKNAKVTLNLNNVPLSDAVEAIGAALGGGWERRGSVYVFRNGVFMAMPGAGFTAKAMPMNEASRAFGMDDPAQAKKWADYAKQMEKRFGENSPFSKDIQKRFGENSRFSKDIQQQFGENGDFARNMQKQFGPGSPFEKQMREQMKGQGVDQKQWEEMRKQMEKEMGPGSPFQKQMQEMQKQFGANSPFHKQMQEQFKGFEGHPFMDGKDFPKFDMKFNSEAFAKAMKAREEALKGLEERMRVSDKGTFVPPLNDPRFSDMQSFKFVMPKMGDFSFGGQDLKGVAKSLTPAQREKNKKQGFLYWSDLTPEQQQKMGMKEASGNWSITYSNNGESFTVKSNPRK